MFAQKEIADAKIKKILEKVPGGTDYTILIFDPMLNDTLFKYNIQKPLIPASNNKLFSSAAALYILGPDFKVYTRIFSDDNDVSDGVVNGNLYIKGYGDASFNSENLDEMIQDLKAAGIREVTGNVYGDDSYFDKEYYRHEWMANVEYEGDLPLISALVLDYNRIKKEVVWSGRKSYKEEKILNPPLQIAEVFLQKLTNAEINVKGKAGEGKTPGEALLLSEFHSPIMELLKRQNKSSDNFYAETVFKILGAVSTGKQGTAINSYQALYSCLKNLGIETKGSSIVDGSGLSRSNYVTAATLGDLLKAVYFDLDIFEWYYKTLTIAGVDGTLGNRMKGTAGENNFRGKTGTLNGVSSLSGYMQTKKGADIILVMIFNYTTYNWTYYRKIKDEIVDAAADY